MIQLQKTKQKNRLKKQINPNKTIDKVINTAVQSNNQNQLPPKKGDEIQFYKIQNKYPK